MSALDYYIGLLIAISIGIWLFIRWTTPALCQKDKRKKKDRRVKKRRGA